MDKLVALIKIQWDWRQGSVDKLLSEQAWWLELESPENMLSVTLPQSSVLSV